MKNSYIKILAFLFMVLILSFSLVSCAENYASSGDVYAADGKSAENGEEAIPENSNTGTNQKSVKGEQSQDKLVYTCDIHIETTDYETASNDIDEKIKSYKGIIESKTEQDTQTNYYSKDTKSGGDMFSTITVKVPSADLEAFMEDISGVGKVTSKSMNVENISSQYNDVEARISALEIQQTRLLEMLKEADNIDDMLAIESRLTEVETELNRYKTEKSSMDVQVAYSTVTIYLDEVVEYSKDGTVVKTNTFWDRLGNTLKDSWQSFLAILEGLLFFIIRAFPVILILGAIVFLIVFIVRAIVKKNRKKIKTQNYYNPYNNIPVQNNNNPAQNMVKSESVKDNTGTKQ